MTDFDEHMSLHRAREVLRGLAEEGHECPCCRQFVKVYRRRIHATMARELIRCYRSATPGDWFHLPSVVGYRGGDVCKVAYWGLMVEEPVERDDGGRAGWWRVTRRGVRFVQREVSVPKHARVYNGRCLSLAGDPVSIVDCLGDRFSYVELMNS